MERFIHKGISLEYEDSGSGKPFLFLHGMGGSMEQIHSIYEPVDGVRLITFNQQGHGNSGADWKTYCFDSLGDDAVALLDHLGIEKAVFGGISMGAAVSLNAAVRYPERLEQLLLIRNAWTDHPMQEKVQTAFSDLGWSLDNGGLDAFLHLMGWRIVKDSSDYTRNAFLRPFDDPSCVKNWKKYLILPKQVPIKDSMELKRLTMPVTVIACREDLCHPFEYGTYLAEEIGHAVFIEIPNKDTDGLAHKRMINKAIRDIFCGK